MNAKHTPGPWTADIPDCWGSMVIKSAEGQYLAKLAAIDSSFAPDDDTAQANAHLIAAAPELLAALQAVMDDLDTTVGEGAEVRDVSPQVQVQLRGAIAKATGSAS